MRKVYNVLQNEAQTSFHLQEKAVFKATGQVLADSDAQAFIYIVEENEQYSYLAFQYDTWESLLYYLKQQQDPVVVIQNESMILTDFCEELQSLVFNIEGNSNYGEQFVEMVEAVFAPVLQK